MRGLQPTPCPRATGGGKQATTASMLRLALCSLAPLGREYSYPLNIEQRHVAVDLVQHPGALNVALGRDHHPRRDFFVRIENFCRKIGCTAHVICPVVD